MSQADRGRPTRVRVTFGASGRTADTAPTQGLALPGAPVREAEAIFLNGLMRAQLRLAGACLTGFILVSLLFTVGVMVIASIGDPVAFGVPLSWILHAYGYYPIIVFFAVLFARGAARNERRYRMLTEDEHERASDLT